MQPFVAWCFPCSTVALVAKFYVFPTRKKTELFYYSFLLTNCVFFDLCECSSFLASLLAVKQLVLVLLRSDFFQRSDDESVYNLNIFRFVAWHGLRIPMFFSVAAWRACVRLMFFTGMLCPAVRC